MMKPMEINTLVFFNEAVEAKRLQVLYAMAEAIAQCRKAVVLDTELSERGKVGVMRLAELQTIIYRVYEQGQNFFEGTGVQILTNLLIQFRTFLTETHLCDSEWLLIYAELSFMMDSLMQGEWFE